MNDFNTAYGHAPAGALDTSVDAGLRRFMLGVYNKMAAGLILSAVIAYIVGTVAPVTALVFGTPLVFLVQWGPLVLLLGSAFLMRNPSPTGSAVLYWSIVSLLGASMGFWVMIAANNITATTAAGTGLAIDFTDIALAFGITSAAFLGLSVYGYTTKRNMTGIGSALFMLMIGAVVLGLLNAFLLKSGMIELLLQFAVLAIMSVLIAFQTQALKVSYYQIQGDQRSMAVMTNMGALNLYIAFVNIFQIVLSLLSRE